MCLHQKGQSTKEQIFSNRSGSSQYEEFLNTLGKKNSLFLFFYFFYFNFILIFCYFIIYLFFLLFILLLGWSVPVKHNSPTFLGGLDSEVHGPTTPYYCDYNTEMVFHVSTLMNNDPNNPEQAHKQKLLTRSRSCHCKKKKITKKDY